MARSDATHRTIREVQKAKFNKETRFRVDSQFVPEQLPDELLDWPELEYLELEMYMGPLAGLKALPRLRELRLKRGRLAEDFAEATQVKRLRVTHDTLERLPELETAAQLEVLELDLYSCLRELPSLSRMRGLRELRITAHKVPHLPADFGDLLSLTLCHLMMSGVLRLPESFAQLTALEDLVFETSPEWQPDPVVGALRQLRKLRIAPGPGLSATDVPHIDLPETYAQLTKLRTLDIWRNTHVPPFMAELKQLTYLQLVGVQTAPPLVETLEELHLPHCQLKELPATLENLQRLRVLDLCFSDLAALPPLPPGLEHLDVSHCPLLRALPRLPTTLEVLLVHGPIAEVDFAPCRNLVRLQLYATDLTSLPDSLGGIESLKQVTIALNPRLESLPAFGASVRLAAGNNGPAPARGLDDNDEPELTYWIHGLSALDNVLTLDVEAIQSTEDYPETRRETWTLDLDTGPLEQTEASADFEMRCDCGYHREHFANTLGEPDTSDPGATRVPVLLHADGRRTEIFLPGDVECLESPIGVTLRRHSYKSDRIALLAVNEDEIYLTAKLAWSIVYRTYVLLRGSARGRVWRLVAEREHERLAGLVYHGGETLLGTSAGVYRVRADRLEPYALGFDAALLYTDGQRLIVGGGTSAALFIVRDGRVEEGLQLDFNAKTTGQATAVARDETRAVAELLRTGYLPAAPELVPAPPALGPALRQALTALDAGDFATARRLLADAPAGALRWRLLAHVAEKGGAPEEALGPCDAYLALRPLDVAMHAQKAALLARLGRTAEHEDARLKMIDVEDAGATLFFAQSWLNKRTNFANVEARLQEANLIVPDTFPIVWMLFQLRLAQARVSEASELLAHLEAIEGPNDHLTHARAQLLQAQGDTAGALAQYCLLAPLYLAETPDAWFNLGLLRAGRDDRALIVEMTRLLCFKPEHAAACEARRAALRRCGETNVSSWG